MKKYIVSFIIVGFLFVVSGCEYKQSKVYKVKTADGGVIYLMCPELDPDQNMFTYLYDKECYVVSRDYHSK